MPIYVFVMQALCLQCMLGPRAFKNTYCVECCLQFFLHPILKKSALCDLFEVSMDTNHDQYFRR